MGGSGSKFVKKIVSPFSSSSNSGLNTEKEDSSSSNQQNSESTNMTKPLVLSRQGSMFFDEDGDLAHEFYEEVMPSKKGSKATMKRIVINLIPQGEVAHQIPRLHPDFPISVRKTTVVAVEEQELQNNVDEKRYSLSPLKPPLGDEHNNYSYSTQCFALC